ncbi:hypothetical protein Bequi_09960 [Brachybacterium sp. JHP9]|uniref:Uncharacterized protein n=1 Tax=Brachybacterium equifaecis TaxID=2910770 RepID=A0ABT0R2L6_9MICO|nr:hypothetical protein [Brachybacterium equifaecis]MCL6423708.1 hypothetical protein [Brachybacterium equifaecis]
MSKAQADGRIYALAPVSDGTLVICQNESIPRVLHLDVPADAVIASARIERAGTRAVVGAFTTGIILLAYPLFELTGSAVLVAALTAAAIAAVIALALMPLAIPAEHVLATFTGAEAQSILDAAPGPGSTDAGGGLEGLQAGHPPVSTRQLSTEEPTR